MRKHNWNTYNTQKTVRGIRYHQIRKTPSGWQIRTKQVNKPEVTYSGVTTMSDTDGENAFASSKMNELRRQTHKLKQKQK